MLMMHIFRLDSRFRGNDRGLEGNNFILHYKYSRYLWLLCPVIAAASFLISFQALGLSLNLTPSMDEGVWQKAAYEAPKTYPLKGHPLKGKAVTLCPSLENPVIALAKTRGFLKPGACANGLMPLLKPVAATGGDTVILTREAVIINGRSIPNTATLEKDGTGRPLPHYPFGSYKVATDELWLLAPSNSHSFDSRYFGPVKVGDVQDILEPILIWKRHTLKKLMHECSRSVGHKTLSSIIKAESGGNPWIIGNNTTGRSYNYTNYESATRAASAFLGLGHNIDIGLMQVNSSNLARLNLTPEQALEPCANIQAGSTILRQFYAAALQHTNNPQVALRRALSGYNTGSMWRGERYVERILNTIEG